MGEPTLTKELSDVRDKLVYFKSKAYAEFGQKEGNPLAEVIRICYVAHVQLLLAIIDEGKRC